MFYLLLLVMFPCVYCKHTVKEQQLNSAERCKVSRDHVYGGNLTDCSGMGIHALPLLGLRDNITTLILNWNMIRCLPNMSFNATNLHSLRHLSIRSSKVEAIEVNALFGLVNLEILNLEDNYLPICQKTGRSYPAGMFTHVPNLRHLFIGSNNKHREKISECRSYPDNIDIFWSLTHLTNLSIDTFNETLYLGHEFSNLTRLTNLTVECPLVAYIYNNSLEGLEGLQIIVFSLVAFKHEVIIFELGIFQYLHNVMFLSVVDSRVGNHNMLIALWPFAHRNMTSLFLKQSSYAATYSVPSYSLADGIIGLSVASSLRSICVAHFAWIGSLLFAFEPKSLTSETWIQCIRTIDLSNNKLENIGWVTTTLEARKLKYVTSIFLSSVASLQSSQYPHLIHFKIPENLTKERESYVEHLNNNITVKTANSKQKQAQPDFISHNYYDHTTAWITNGMDINNTYRINEQDKITSNHSHANSMEENNSNIRIGRFNKSTANYSSVNALRTYQGRQLYFPYQGRQLYFPYQGGQSQFPYNGNITYYFLPSLRIVKIINMIFGPLELGTWTFVCKSSKNLEQLYWVNNYLLQIRGKIYGMENLKVLDLTGSMFDIPDNLFDTFSGLQVFVLRGVKPDTFFKQISVQRLIRNLTNLRYLDVSNNKLNVLPSSKMFTSNPNMTHVILSQNRFSNIPFDLVTTPKLQVLDLSENAILFLTEEEMEALNNHAALVNDFVLMLRDNGIACVCSQMNYLVWLFTTHVKVDQTSTRNCRSDDGQRVRLNGLSDIPVLAKLCLGRICLMVSLVLQISMGLAFLLTYLFIRFQTAIKAILARIFVPLFRPMLPEDYKIGVFIGYADDDYRYVKHVLLRYLEDDLNLKTFVHQRDLEQGPIDQQFIEAIRNSWRVVLVLSRTFLNQYGMADIVMKYASHSVTTVNQNRVFVLVEEDQICAIPDYLHTVLDDRRIISIQDLHHKLDYEQKESIKQCLRPSQ